jgi:hypothetical protein
MYTVCVFTTALLSPLCLQGVSPVVIVFDTARVAVEAVGVVVVPLVEVRYAAMLSNSIVQQSYHALA